MTRVRKKPLVWVVKTERLPTETGVYVTMNRRLTSPRLLRLDGALDKHWEWVTHWLGPIPVCGG
jgi:hypothetical protein